MNIRALPIGRYEDGSPVLVNLESRNGLLNGSPRSGKSVALAALLCGLCRCPHERVAVLSPKVLDFHKFAPAVRLIKDPAAMLDYLEELHGEAERRKEWCTERGLKKIAPEHYSAVPHLTTIIDEFTVVRRSVVQDEKGKPVKVGERIEAEVMKLVAETGFAGLSFVISTQRASGQNITTDLRDIVSGFRASFATETPETDRMVFGEYASEAPCHLITTEQKGVGYISIDGQPPRPFRGALTTDEDEAAAAAEAVKRGNLWQ